MQNLFELQTTMRQNSTKPSRFARVTFAFVKLLIRRVCSISPTHLHQELKRDNTIRIALSAAAAAAALSIKHGCLPLPFGLRSPSRLHAACSLARKRSRLSRSGNKIMLLSLFDLSLPACRIELLNKLCITRSNLCKVLYLLTIFMFMLSSFCGHTFR